MSIETQHFECTETPIEYPITIERIPLGERTFNLIQETYLPAGTKQRGITFFEKLKAEHVEEVVTYGTAYGYGQVATAWCCKQVGLNCTVFVTKLRRRTEMTKLAIHLGANIVEVKPSKQYLYRNSSEYAEADPGRRFVGLGLDDPDYIQALAEGIMKVSGHLNPKRIWIAGGSLTIARALAIAFPNTKLMIVQVGRTLYPDILATLNHTLYKSSEPFTRNCKLPPPYPSLQHYDAKIWRFIRLFGADGDYIWNVK